MWQTSTSRIIREEAPGDVAAIAVVTARAFADAPHSNGTEANIVDRLRADGHLMLSLIADDGGEIVGHAAFSPVKIDGVKTGWFGLGPVSVAPSHQGIGVGSALIEEGLERLRSDGAKGCVVLGDPGYYGRFGFTQDPQLRFPGPPASYFQRVMLTDAKPPTGIVGYASAFTG